MHDRDALANLVTNKDLLFSGRLMQMSDIGRCGARIGDLGMCM